MTIGGHVAGWTRGGTGAGVITPLRAVAIGATTVFTLEVALFVVVPFGATFFAMDFRATVIDCSRTNEPVVALATPGNNRAR